ncbi:MAG: hypothetical protein ACE5GA_00580 [Candidatus Zixiibacteriota bacterium]
MKPLLLISYFFPPIGMAGPGRALGLFRHLPEFGYRPYVLTVKDIVYPAHDASQLTEADEEFVTRTESWDPSRLLYRIGKRTPTRPNLTGRMSALATPDWQVFWRRFALKEAQRLIREHDIKLALTTSPPPSIHRIGKTLKERHGLKWVADFRDMWVTRPIEHAYAGQRQRSQALSELNGIRESADMIVAVNDSVGGYVRAGRIVPNGADPAASTMWDNVSPHKDRVFRIGYLGATDSAQTLRPFVTSLSAALEQSGALAHDIEVQFVGRVNETLLRSLFAEAKLSQSLKLCGYLPRGDAIRRLAGADALLVTLPDDELSHVTGSKIFDYLASGKPIIALAPLGSELGKLALAEGERVFEATETEKLAAHLADALNRRRVGPDSPETDRRALKRRREEYSWRTMAMRFAGILDELD